ncbi:unnamed protein product [Coccothraustes coccothraustes]
MTSIPVASADCPSDSPSPRFEAAAGGCGERWVRRERFRNCQGGSVGADPGSCGAQCPLPVPQPSPVSPAPPRWGGALPSPDSLRGLPGSSREVSPRFIRTEDAEAAAGEDLFLR